MRKYFWFRTYLHCLLMFLIWHFDRFVVEHNLHHTTATIATREWTDSTVDCKKNEHCQNKIEKFYNIPIVWKLLTRYRLGLWSKFNGILKNYLVGRYKKIFIFFFFATNCNDVKCNSYLFTWGSCEKQNIWKRAL
jgi:hypothetical protein